MRRRGRGGLVHGGSDQAAREARWRIFRAAAEERGKPPSPSSQERNRALPTVNLSCSTRTRTLLLFLSPSHHPPPSTGSAPTMPLSVPRAPCPL
ncbi:hypothetical protein AAFF_G00388960 [Aldrovandia affinis]|uniref:Uncharacterized protein n=1 Tax=Aldrovandia affinis TaxID=143900 RepID=A0AAD7SEC1_9TELE|nr:hypothetical protein AAFF_G00388960 [Aldrovandia affinis]